MGSWGMAKTDTVWMLEYVREGRTLYLKSVEPRTATIEKRDALKFASWIDAVDFIREYIIPVHYKVVEVLRKEAT